MTNRYRVARMVMDSKEELFMAWDILKEIRRATRRKSSVDRKIRIVPEG